MRRVHDWSKYVSKLSDRDDTVHQKTVYAKQWANDARCVQSGLSHRRVGESQHRSTHDEWLQAGYVAHQKTKPRS